MSSENDGRADRTVGAETANSPGDILTEFVGAAMARPDIVVLSVDDFTYGDQGWRLLGLGAPEVGHGRIFLTGADGPVTKAVTVPSDTVLATVRVDVEADDPAIVTHDLLHVSAGETALSLTSMTAVAQETGSPFGYSSVMLFEQPLVRGAARAAEVKIVLPPGFDGQIAIDDVVIIATIDTRYVRSDVLTSDQRYPELFQSDAGLAVLSPRADATRASSLGADRDGAQGVSAPGRLTDIRIFDRSANGDGGGRLGVGDSLPRAPEIGAADGLGALALVGALTALFWERRRRR